MNLQTMNLQLYWDNIVPMIQFLMFLSGVGSVVIGAVAIGMRGERDISQAAKNLARNTALILLALFLVCFFISPIPTTKDLVEHQKLVCPSPCAEKVTPLEQP